MRMRRSRMSKPPFGFGSATSRRVELVPMSIAATFSVMAAFTLVQLLLDPSADRIVATGEEPCVVRVQALHALTSATDPAERTGSAVLRRNGRVALARVRAVGALEVGVVDGRLCGPHTAGRLELADGAPFEVADQPVARRHRRPIVQDRWVADHDRLAGRGTHDDLDVAPRRTAEQRFHRSAVTTHARAAATTSTRLPAGSR